VNLLAWPPCQVAHTLEIQVHSGRKYSSPATGIAASADQAS